MKILNVGGAGYVGGVLTDYLLEYNYDITVYDNLVYENRYLKDVEFIFGDIRDREKLSQILPKYDCVIWLAAIVGDGACAVDMNITKEVNEDSVKWLVDNYDGKICYPSTCSIYGINNDLIKEDAIPNPLSMYASTKLAAEQYIVNNHKDYLIFRLGTLFGMGDRHSRIRLDLVANVLTKRAVYGQPLTVYGGEQWRPLLHVKDVSTAFIYGINNNVKGLYNLSLGNWQIRDLANEIKEIIPGTDVKYQDIKFEDARNYRVSNEKILATGWKPEFNLKDGITEMAKIMKEKRIKDIDDVVYSNVDYLKKAWR